VDLLVGGQDFRVQDLLGQSEHLVRKIRLLHEGISKITNNPGSLLLDLMLLTVDTHLKDLEDALQVRIIL